MLSKGFVKKSYDKNKEIKLDEKGFRYLEKYSVIISFIDEFEL